MTKAATLTKVGIAFGAALGVAAGYYALHRHAEPPAIANVAPRAAAPQPVAPAPVPAPAPEPVAPRSASPQVAGNRSDGARSRKRASRTGAAPAATPDRVQVPPRASDTTASDPAASDTAASDTAASDTAAAREAPVAAPAPVVPPAQPAPAPAQPETPAPSIDELQGIARARVLVNRDPQAALDLLSSVARAHPRGYFVEERNALTILALFGVGQRDTATLRAEQFLRAHPKSPFADRIRAALER